ncbi:recombinase family protein [Nonomuraea sp. B19D2]|uniref:recombinase family protein n=1 Tax=Nonomuraea sp. B19D2 TaxID=3159561 RepID=UPI0032DB232B
MNALLLRMLATCRALRASVQTTSKTDTRPETSGGRIEFRDCFRDHRGMGDSTTAAVASTGPSPAAPANAIRVGYARISTRAQDHLSQMEALTAARCREIVVETASTRKDRPKLQAAVAAMKAGDTLVIYKPDRVARSVKELLVFLEDELAPRGINLMRLRSGEAPWGSQEACGPVPGFSRPDVSRMRACWSMSSFRQSPR